MNSSADASALADDDARSEEHIQAPPRGWLATLGQLGPGLIIAGSIVGSGELIATTKTGAQAGIVLMWLIIVGCLIKVFVQIELGRYSITHGKTTLAALNTLPGRLHVNWMLWFWLAMMAASLFQLGGIVGGVGQALAISFPITGDYRNAMLVPAQPELERYLAWEADRSSGGGKLAQLSEVDRGRILQGQEVMAGRLSALGAEGQSVLETVRSGQSLTEPKTVDDVYWAAAAALVTAALLANGRYGLIQSLSTALVVAFTFITVGNVYALQTTPQWSIPWEEWLSGLKFSLPQGGGKGVATALATFGIIGVGAAELFAYPYWCIEKGYARYTGPRTDDESWAVRARGWMRVMHVDALVSMMIYTVATVAFFVVGVAVLNRKGLDPDKNRMISVLAESYVPVFGAYAKWLFLIGAIAVLYSTFLVALASHARLYTDALKIWGLMDPHDEAKHRRSVSLFGMLLPLFCLSTYWAGINPVRAVLFSGTMQALMLPMLAFAALYFRYFRTDPRLAPRPGWDLLLIVSSVGLLVAGVWGTYAEIARYFGSA
ncbi:MAG: Nramp family divalent metal transporter [Planctomycetaceae bacterium]